SAWRNSRRYESSAPAGTGLGPWPMGPRARACAWGQSAGRRGEPSLPQPGTLVLLASHQGPCIPRRRRLIMRQGRQVRDMTAEKITGEATSLLAGQAGYLISMAARAPSVHNTQPWRFKVGQRAIELYADTSRKL